MLIIVIINWNTKNLLIQCINHLKKIKIGIPYEIVVVDNGSEDGSREYLQTKFYGKKILLDKNYGFAKACNTAASSFYADKYLFLNTDAFPEKNSIEELYTILDEKEEIAVISPQLLNKNKTKQKTAHNFHWILKDNILGKYAYLPDTFNEENELYKETDSITGACMMIKGNVFRLLNGFDEDYFFFLEETDFCLRCRKLGFKAAVSKRAKCIHLKGESAKKDIIKYRTIFLTSQFLFFKKHLPHKIYNIYKTTIISKVAYKTIIYAVFSILTLTLIKKFTQKFKLYSNFLINKLWKDADNNFSGIRRIGNIYNKLKTDYCFGFIRQDILKSINTLMPIEENINTNSTTIKKTQNTTIAYFNTSPLKINIKEFRNKRKSFSFSYFPEKAFYGACVLKSIGINIPDPLGYIINKNYKISGYLITKHLEGLKVLNFTAVDIFEACKSNRKRFKPLKKKLIESIAFSIKKLHERKIIHKDLKASNILIRSNYESSNPFEIYIIDFETITVAPILFERFKIKNLSQLHKSFPDLSMFTPSERIYFLKKYLGISKLDKNAKNLIKKIENKAKKMLNRKGLNFYYSERISK